MKVGYMRLQAVFRSRSLTQHFSVLRTHMVGFQVSAAPIDNPLLHRNVT